MRFLFDSVHIEECTVFHRLQNVDFKFNPIKHHFNRRELGQAPGISEVLECAYC